MPSERPHGGRSGVWRPHGGRAAAARAALALTCALIGVLAVAGGCARWLRDAPTGDRAARFESVELQTCLGRAPNALAAYFRRSAGGANQLDDAFGCADRALTLFETKARFARPGVWSVEEVQKFAETYLRGGTLSPAAVRGAFRLKRALLGGTEMEATRVDIGRLRALLAHLRAQARSLEPFADVYSLNAAIDRSRPEDRARLDRAIEALVGAAHDVAALLAGPSRPPYRVRDLLDIAASVNPDWDGRAYVGLLEAAKSILISAAPTPASQPPSPSSGDGRPPATIAAEEWPIALDIGARAFGERLRYAYFMKDGSIYDLEVVDAVETTARRAFALLREAVGRRALGDSIRLAEWERLAAELGDLGWLPLGLKAESARLSMRPLFVNLLRQPGAPARADRPEGMGPSQIARAESVFEDWLRGHRLAAAIAPNDSWSIERLRDFFSVGHSAHPAADQPDEMASAPAQDMASLFWLGRPISWRSSRILIATNEEPQTRAELMLTNAIRWAARWVLESYANDRARALAAGGLTDAETQRFYLDARPLGVDLGIMDPRVRNAGTRSFMEATLFTSVAQGGDLLPLRAASEFFAMILSGGRAAQEIYAAALPGCRSTTLDPFGQARLEAACFRRYLRQNFARHFSHLPGLVAEMSSAAGGVNDAAGDAKWNSLFVAVENAARSGGASEDPIESSEIKVMAPVLQYAESLAVRFDVEPRDGRIDGAEIEPAFLVFQGFIRKLSLEASPVPLRYESVDRTVFTYLMRNGGPPQGGVGALGAVWWYGLSQAANLESWGLGRRDFANVQANRISLLQIIASINSLSRSRRTKAIESWYESGGHAASRYRAARSRAQRAEALFRGDDAATGAALAELFGCSPETGRAILRVGRERTAQILFTRPTGVVEGQEFGRNMSRALRADPETAAACVPPF